MEDVAIVELLLSEVDGLTAVEALKRRRQPWEAGKTFAANTCKEKKREFELFQSPQLQRNQVTGRTFLGPLGFEFADPDEPEDVLPPVLTAGPATGRKPSD